MLSSEVRSNAISSKKPLQILQLRLTLAFLGTHHALEHLVTDLTFCLVQLQDDITCLGFIFVIPVTPTYVPRTLSLCIELVRNCLRSYHVLRVYKPFLGFRLSKFNYRNNLNKGLSSLENLVSL